MVFTFPKEETRPSLGDLLGGGLGAGMQSGLQMLAQQKLNEMAARGKLAQEQQLKKQKFALKQELLNNILGQQKKEGDPESNLSDLTNEQISKVSIIDPELGKTLQDQRKFELEQEKFEFQKRKEEKKGQFISPETKDRLENVFKRQKELVKGGNIGFGSMAKLLTPKTQKDWAEFNELSGSIEMALLPLVSKGTLAKQRFKYIMSLLPKPHNTQATIKGKIKGLKREFGLLKKKGIVSDTDEIKTGGQEEEHAKKLTTEMAQKILKAAGGDKKKQENKQRKLDIVFRCNMADIFDEVELEQEPVEAEQPTDKLAKSRELAKEFKVYGWQPKAETVEKFRKPIKQKVVGPGMKLFTSMRLGGPGDLASFLNDLIAKPAAEAITGKEGVPFEDTPIGSILPTSEKLHTGIEEMAGEKFRPETAGEEIAGTGLGFLGSAFSLGPAGFLKPGSVPFFRKVMPPLIKNVINAFVPASVATATKEGKLPPWAQSSATIATSILTHRATGQSLTTIKNNLYSKADKLAENVVIPANKLMDRLKILEEDMAIGFTTPAKTRIRSLINELRGKAAGGVLQLKELIKDRKELIKIRKEFTPQEMKDYKREWKQLRGSIDKSIGDYEKLNPEFSQVYREANSLNRGMEESKRIGNFFKNHRTLSSIGGTATAVLLSLLKSSAGIAAAPTAALALKTAYFTKALVKNPGFRRTYQNVMKASASESVKGTASALKKFNEIAEKENVFKKEKKKDIFDEL